ITGIPPAVAVTHKATTRSSRSTVGTATETNDYLRLLFAKIGHVICQTCGHEVRRESPQSAAETLAGLPEGTRFLVGFEWPDGLKQTGGTAGSPNSEDPDYSLQQHELAFDSKPETQHPHPSPLSKGEGDLTARLKSQGFVRVVVDDQIVNL